MGDSGTLLTALYTAIGQLGIGSGRAAPGGPRAVRTNRAPALPAV